MAHPRPSIDSLTPPSPRDQFNPKTEDSSSNEKLKHSLDIYLIP